MSLGMDPGLLRERIEFLEEGRVDDGQGGADLQWVPIPNGIDWARIRPSTRTNRQNGGRSDSVASFEVTIRHRADITKDHRVEWGNRVLALTGAPANLDERGEFVVFPAAEVTS